MNTDKTFDVFLSFNSEAQKIVERIAVYLVDEAGLRVWLDKWRLIPGESVIRNIERGLQAARTCAVFVGADGQGPWQRKEVEMAIRSQILNPDFRVIPVLLPGAQKPKELPAFLDDNVWIEFGEGLDDPAMWRLECGIRGQPPGRGRPPTTTRRSNEPVPEYDPRGLTAPGGALATDARFYIERTADQEVLSGIRKNRALVTLRGARQSGKTSLIARVHVAVSGGRLPLRSAFVDVQAIPAESLQSLEAAWRYLAEGIAEQLELPCKWVGQGNHERGFQEFLKNTVFAEDDTPLLICLDEVDRFFSTPLRKEFFASLRACWNKGAYHPTWKKVHWLLSTSSDPVFFIQDLTQSPFNIGQLVRLDNFNLAQIEALASRLRVPLPAGEAAAILAYVGGRPYLVHLLLYHLARDPEARDDLFDGTTAGDGVFRDHLYRYLIHFEQDGALAEAMHRLLAGHQMETRLAERLEAAGLAYQDAKGEYRPACRLYADFFGKTLGWIEKVEELYSLIKETLNKKTSNDVKEIEYKIDTNRVTSEELMERYDVLPNNAPILDLFVEKQLTATFKPIGPWVVGARGRIDILTKNGAYLLADLGEDETTPEWKVFPPKSKGKGKPFDAQFITGLVR